MREFDCKSLGNDCTWKHIAKTEELLADIVAVHLRDVHGVQEVGPDMVGKIKNLFKFPTAADAAGAADLVLKEYNCDMGPKCTWRYKGDRGPARRRSSGSCQGPWDRELHRDDSQSKTAHEWDWKARNERR
jgi:predicted small metal-binding protein